MFDAHFGVVGAPIVGYFGGDMDDEDVVGKIGGYFDGVANPVDGLRELPCAEVGDFFQIPFFMENFDLRLSEAETDGIALDTQFHVPKLQLFERLRKY